jgi:hypothetical protein
MVDIDHLISGNDAISDRAKSRRVTAPFQSQRGRSPSAAGEQRVAVRLTGDTPLTGVRRPTRFSTTTVWPRLSAHFCPMMRATIVAPPYQSDDQADRPVRVVVPG